MTITDQTPRRIDPDNARCDCLHDFDELPYPYAEYRGQPFHPPYTRGDLQPHEPGERLRCPKPGEFAVRSGYPSYDREQKADDLDEGEETVLCRDCAAGWLLEKVKWWRLTIRPLRPR